MRPMVSPFLYNQHLSVAWRMSTKFIHTWIYPMAKIIVFLFFMNRRVNVWRSSLVA